MELILDHWSDDPEMETVIGEKIENYLKKNDFHYAVQSVYPYEDGIRIWFDELPPYDFTDKNEKIKKICDLAEFLIDKLHIPKNCFHFVLQTIVINGNGQAEGIYQSLNRIIFEELTGVNLPKELEETRFEHIEKWIKNINDFVKKSKLKDT